MIALRDDPALRCLLCFDEMLNAPMINGQVPSLNIDLVPSANPAIRRVEDADILSLQEYLQRSGLTQITKATVTDAVLARARERSFHPVKDYLNSLRWDKTRRLEGWLSNYLGAEPSAYCDAIGPMVLIAMVARIFRPGAKCDYMMVLEGPQRARKSTACKILGGEWFSDNLPPLRYAAKDASLHLNGKWLIEIAELASTKNADSDLLKAFITRTHENYRPPYGRFEISQPRQCILVGTTNKEAYLDDPTGGRRFWPVKVGTIDCDALARDRDQLFAEAAARYRGGECWWPDRAFEETHISPQQADRYEADAWEEPIRDYLFGKSKVLIMQVAKEALQIDTANLGTANQNRIRGVLTSLGWKQTQRGPKGERFYSGPGEP